VATGIKFDISDDTTEETGNYFFTPVLSFGKNKAQHGPANLYPMYQDIAQSSQDREVAIGRHAQVDVSREIITIQCHKINM
jgi:hypothetical protein